MKQIINKRKISEVSNKDQSDELQCIVAKAKKTLMNSDDNELSDNNSNKPKCDTSAQTKLYIKNVITNNKPTMPQYTEPTQNKCDILEEENNKEDMNVDDIKPQDNRREKPPAPVLIHGQ